MFVVVLIPPFDQLASIRQDAPVLIHANFARSTKLLRYALCDMRKTTSSFLENVKIIIFLSTWLFLSSAFLSQFADLLLAGLSVLLSSSSKPPRTPRQTNRFLRFVRQRHKWLLWLSSISHQKEAYRALPHPVTLPQEAAPIHCGLLGVSFALDFSWFVSVPYFFFLYLELCSH